MRCRECPDRLWRDQTLPMWIGPRPRRGLCLQVFGLGATCSGSGLGFSDMDLDKLARGAQVLSPAGGDQPRYVGCFGF